MFEVNGKGIVTLMVGEAIQSDISVLLTPEEIEEVRKNESFAEAIVDDIRMNRNKYSARQLLSTIWPPKDSARPIRD
jgi:hypothetical protein